VAWCGSPRDASVSHLASKENTKMAEEPIVLEIFTDYV
jgi:hypothetical protein